VKQLAKLAGISPRTLHYYDEIRLLKPSHTGENGYRYYQHEQLMKLMQIMFYRELEFPLEDIGALMKASTHDMAEALENQKKLLGMKYARTKRLLKTLDQLIGSMKGTTTMNAKKALNDFDRSDYDEYKDEVKQRWGHTDAYRQSMERTKNWTKTDYDQVKVNFGEIAQGIAAMMDRKVSDTEVQAFIKKQHEQISVFYDCSLEMYRGLGEMYFADPRFAATYDKVKPGLAKFMKEAIACYCDRQKG